MQLSETLKSEIEEYAAHFGAEHALFAKARRGELGPNAVARYLSSILYLLRRTPEHMELAAAEALAAGKPDLADYYRDTCKEEVGHDRWAISDLAVLSRSFNAQYEITPARFAVDLAQFVESTIRRDPSLYIVYKLFAEYFTVVCGPIWVEMLSTRCGIPKSALTVVDKHVEADSEHSAEGFEAATRFLSGPGLHEESLATLRGTFEQFGKFLDEIEQIPN